MAMKIHAVVRIPRRHSHCGSVLMLITSLGKVELDGEDMEFDHDVGEIFKVGMGWSVPARIGSDQTPHKQHVLPFTGGGLPC